MPACVILSSNTEMLKCRSTKHKWLGSSNVGDLPVNCERRQEGTGNDDMMVHDSKGTWRVDTGCIKRSDQRMD